MMLTSQRAIFPTIESITDNCHRPLWSVMIPTYNGTRYLEQTLRSVLEQDPGAKEMQIEVIDDCSTRGEPEALVQKIGKGRVSFYRQAQNHGLIGNWNACLERSRGHWVHVLHQDDVVLPGFYSHLQQAIDNQEFPGAAFCRHVHMDEDGHWQRLSPLERRTPGIIKNWVEKIAVKQCIQCPAIVVKRCVYEKQGGFCADAHYAADWEMWKRISAHYPIWYEPQVLACYRVHSASETARVFKSGQDVIDIRTAIEISVSYLPADGARELSKAAREKWALYALTKARQLSIENDLELIAVRVREAFHCSTSIRVMVSVLFLISFLGKRWIKDKLLSINMQ